MKLLLDTHTFIWWDSASSKLPALILEMLQAVDNELFLSAASVWEMQIKSQLGKLTFNVPLAKVIEEQQQTNNIQILSITLLHILALDGLGPHHKDPFDRLLVAQANVEDLVLVSGDQMFRQYNVQLLWDD